MVVAAPWGDKLDVISAHGMRYVPLHLDKWSMNPLNEIGALFAFYKLYRQEKPDIVHHVTIKPIIYGSLIAKLLQVPLVVNAISGFGYVFLQKGIVAETRKFFVKLLYKYIVRHSQQRTIFQNHDDYRYFLENIAHAADKFNVILGSGIDLKKYNAAKIRRTKRPVVMFVGRLLWDKGIGEFVEAAELIKKQGISSRFIAVGSHVQGNPASVTMTQLEQWISRGPVEFWGHKDQIRDCLEQADIICLPSYREGLPLALLEAAACARPIITTNVPGCKEVVRHGFNGLLVQPRDSSDLFQALKTLIQDQDLRLDMSRKSRLFVESGKYSQRDISLQTLNLYNQVLQSNS